jgi:hypothetical protein
MTRPDPSAVRQRRRRQRGRAVGIVLRDPRAIAALDAGIRMHGGPLAAITVALLMAYPVPRADNCPPESP